MQRWIQKLALISQEKLHDEAELILCDPSNTKRLHLEELTRSHSMYTERYGVMECQNLHEHPACAPCAAECSLDEQKKRYLVLALDCEMVETVNNDMALARVSAVNESGEQVLDFLVMACSDATYIEDTREHITGLTTANIQKDGISIEEARRRFASLCFRDTVLIGHALDHDLLALNFTHDHVIDTCMLFPVAGSPALTHSLEYLTRQVLRRDMDRDARQGVHDSIEDSNNSLDLVKFLVIRHRMTKTNGVAPPILRRPRSKFRGSLPSDLDDLRPGDAFYQFTLWSRSKIANDKKALMQPIRPPPPKPVPEKSAPAAKPFQGLMNVGVKRSSVVRDAQNAFSMIRNKADAAKRFAKLRKKCKR